MESRYRAKEKVSLAGNINEAIDILAEDVELPAVTEGDYLALLITGSYGSISSSSHCMRGKFSEYFLIDEHMSDSGIQFVQNKDLIAFNPIDCV